MVKGKRGRDFSTSYNPLQTLSPDMENMEDDEQLNTDIDEWVKKNEYRRKCEAKILKLNGAAIYPLLSSIVAHYSVLHEFESIKRGNPMQKFMSWIRRCAFKKVLPHHNKLLEKAVAHAISQHYDDFNDISLASYLKSYTRSKHG